MIRLFGCSPISVGWREEGEMGEPKKCIAKVKAIFICMCTKPLLHHIDAKQKISCSVA